MDKLSGLVSPVFKGPEAENLALCLFMCSLIAPRLRNEIDLYEAGIQTLAEWEEREQTCRSDVFY